MINILLSILMAWLLGVYVLSVLLRNERETSLMERLCLAYPLGMGLITLQLFFLGLLRVPLTWVFSILPIILEINAMGLWVTRKGIVVFPRPAAGLAKELLSPEISWIRKAALVILVAWVGLKLGSVFVEMYLRPIFAWDAWANWSASAKLFYFSHNLMLDLPETEFFGRGVAERNLSYPLHNPLSQVWLALWAGSFDEVLVKFSTPFYLLCTAGYLYCVTTRRVGRVIALVILVIFLSSPLMSYHAVEVYSDLPLGVYFFFILACFLCAMKGQKGFWTLIGIFSSEALFTKEEAIFFVFPLLMSATIYIWTYSKHAQDRNKTLLFLFTPLLLIAPWFFFKIYHRLELGGRTLELAFHPEIILASIKCIASLNNFNVVLIFSPFFLILQGKWTSGFSYLFLPLCCFIIFFIALYAFTASTFFWFQNGTIFSRNILADYPSLCLLTVIMVQNILLKQKQ